jgi:TPP-dependent trihydroxycyclohexane-1,2-dione (THcHDO) dehydratase
VSAKPALWLNGKAGCRLRHCRRFWRDAEKKEVVMSDEMQRLRQEVADLRRQLADAVAAGGENYYYSNAALHGWMESREIPAHGRSAGTVKSIIENSHTLDFNQQLNTSSYVNVTFEEEEDEVALMGLRVNLADQTVYPQSYRIHDSVVNYDRPPVELP